MDTMTANFWHGGQKNTSRNVICQTVLNIAVNSKSCIISKISPFSAVTWYTSQFWFLGVQAKVKAMQSEVKAKLARSADHLAENSVW